MTTMSAEILFLDPADVKPAITELEKHGFGIKVLDWVDPYGPTVWIMATVETELDTHRFLNWMSDIVEPLRGDVVKAGLFHPQQAA
jgi:hypothetical protein